MVELKGENFFIILGKFMFYFIQHSLHEVDDDNSKFKYSWIKCIKQDQKRSNLLQIELSSEKNKMQPQFLNISTSDRRLLINSFKCYWQIA